MAPVSTGAYLASNASDPSGSGRCSARASSHSAPIHTSRCSAVVRITGMAFGWMGATSAFGSEVRGRSSGQLADRTDAAAHGVAGRVGEGIGSACWGRTL